MISQTRRMISRLVQRKIKKRSKRKKKRNKRRRKKMFKRSLFRKSRETKGDRIKEGRLAMPQRIGTSLKLSK